MPINSSGNFFSFLQHYLQSGWGVFYAYVLHVLFGRSKSQICDSVVMTLTIYVVNQKTFIDFSVAIKPRQSVRGIRTPCNSNSKITLQVSPNCEFFLICENPSVGVVMEFVTQALLR